MSDDRPSDDDPAGAPEAPPTVLGPEVDAWVADRAVGIARLADSPAAVDAGTRYATGTLSPAASRAIAEASARSRAGEDDAGPADAPRQAAPEEALAVLDRAVAGTRVLGLGHAVSGTHELATLAARVVEHLVRERGATVLAIDASASTTTALDDYVRGDADGQSLEALDRLGRLGWRTREGVALVDALREVNRERPPGERVRVIGIDPELPSLSVLAVSRVLRTTAPDVFASLAPDMAALVTPASQDRLRASVEAAAAALDDPAVVEGSDPEELAEARRHLPLLRRAAAHVAAGDDAPAVRARVMAEAVLEAAESAPSTGDGPSVLVWAHADQVLVADDPAPTAGHLLRAALGEGYYALGLLGGSGEFRAVRHRKRRGPTRSLQVHRFSAVPGLATDLVATAGTDHLVDLRSARDTPLVASWCDDPTSVRTFAEVVSRGVDRTPSRPVVPGRAADGWATVARVRAVTAR